MLDTALKRLYKAKPVQMNTPMSRPSRKRNMNCLPPRALPVQPVAAICAFVVLDVEGGGATLDKAALTPESEPAPESADDARVIEPELPLVVDPRLILFKSARSSAADWQRKSESFSRHFRTT